MAQFCTKCGAAYAEDARFCDACGNPINKPEAIGVASSQAAMILRKKNSRMAIFIGSAIVVLVATGSGIAWWMAPEKASETSFSRAINDYFAKNAPAQDRLLCLSNITYQRDPILVRKFDRSTKDWMDMLTRSGVYSGPEEQQNNSGLFIQTQYAYQLTPIGKASMRKDKLCLASGLKVKSVTGFDQVQDVNGQATALAAATFDMTNEASWLSKSPDRSEILQSRYVQDLSANLRLANIDNKWQVDASKPLLGNRSFPDWPSNLAESPATKSSPGSFFNKLIGFFSFGSHPLVGKWQGENGMLHMEFTKDSFINNGVAVAAGFKTDGDAVIVTPEMTNGVGLRFKIVDKNHILLDAGMMSFTLTRSK